MTEPKQPARRSRGATTKSAAKPSTARPKSSRPATAKPASAKPATAKLKIAKPATAKPAAVKPAPGKPATPKPEIAKPIPATSGPRTIWISGASGFIGTAVVRVLRTRGDTVIAPVRDVRRAQDLIDMGVTVLEDDLLDVDRIAESMRDVDAVIHSAGSYRVGISRGERGAMWDANIGTTTRVLDAAEADRAPRIVYVSTVGVFGNTKGQVVDETYRRNVREGFLGWYDETKFGAHEVAAQRAHAGAPIVFVMPSQVYGPGDHSSIGAQLALAHAGKLPYRAFEGVGLGFVHVGDVAAGIVTALDTGATGRSYVLSGPRHRLGEALAVAARLGGRRLPRVALPDGALRLMVPIGRLIGQPNLREVVSSSAGVTYWASNERAARELGWRPRELEDGLRDTFEALADRAYTRS